MTVILTTHYMKDVAALCKRLVVVTQGSILYDGSLDQIVDRFTSHKIVTLDLDAAPDAAAVARWGFPVRDVSVEDVPLEEIVAELFRADARDAAAAGAAR